MQATSQRQRERSLRIPCNGSRSHASFADLGTWYDYRRRKGESEVKLMIHAVVAEKMGVILGDAESLLKGRVYASVAGTLGVPMGYVESYINGGEASVAMADRLGVNIAAA